VKITVILILFCIHSNAELATRHLIILVKLY